MKKELGAGCNKKMGRDSEGRHKVESGSICIQWIISKFKKVKRRSMQLPSIEELTRTTSANTPSWNSASNHPDSRAKEPVHLLGSADRWGWSSRGTGPGVVLPGADRRAALLHPVCSRGTTAVHGTVVPTCREKCAVL